MTTLTRVRRTGGFTFIEAMISMAIIVMMMVAILGLFDFTSRLSRVQLQVADMQQELRTGQAELARFTRMAGRGGLTSEIAPLFIPAAIAGHILPDGAAISRPVNNATASTHIGTATSPLIYPGTDVLTVRGAFASPIFQINYSDPQQIKLFDSAGVSTTDPTQARTMKIEVCTTSPAGIAQDLTVLQQAIANASPEAVIIVSPLQDAIFGVVALDPANSTLTSADCVTGVPAAGMTLAFKIGSKTTGGTSPEDRYADLSPAPEAGRLLPALTSVAFLTVLEEYRYYVRQEYINPADTTSLLAPRLSRARFYPNTNNPYGASAQNLSLDIAENVVDLQVAFGIDANRNDLVDDTTGSCGDEWQGNGIGTETRPVPPAADICAWYQKPLYYVRLTTVARTDRFDPAYIAPLLGQVEDHVYPAAGSGENTDENRHRRRRLAQTVVKLRNL